MTELMKRYEAETGECATWAWHEREFLTDDYIAWLESQLTWRPVSEKPEKCGEYWTRIKMFIGNVAYDYHIFDGREFIGIGSALITHWLPVPPAPRKVV